MTHLKAILKVSMGISKTGYTLILSGMSKSGQTSNMSFYEQLQNFLHVNIVHAQRYAANYFSPYGFQRFPIPKIWASLNFHQ